MLVIGAGGLGCPAATYLAGAGIGHLGIIDGDSVEVSNLHRQIGHTTSRVGLSKAASLVESLRQLNPLPRFTIHAEPLTPDNAVSIISAYGFVLDCTDHPAVRYLISDACVRVGRPLVSAAALRTDGQLTILNWPVGVGPCYRCLFPRPPPAAGQLSCAEGGVLGPVVGIMGVLQALQTLRIILEGEQETLKQAAERRPPSLLLFSAADGHGKLSTPSFRTVRLRGRRQDCFACSPSAPLANMGGNEIINAWPDYVQFCGGCNDKGLQLAPEERVSVQNIHDVLEHAKGGVSCRHWLIDVREKEFFDMGSLDGALNIPFSRIQAAIAPHGTTRTKKEDGQHTWPEWLPDGMREDAAPIYVLCRVGINSQIVVKQLKELGLDKQGTRFIGDIKGGIRAWKADIDRTIPFT